MSESTGPTPAGWYGDPANPTLLRWWNGAAWTAHTMATPPPAPPPPPVLPTPQATREYEPVLDGAGRPYVPFQNATASYLAASYEPSRPTRSTTASVWILATSTLWWIAAELLLVVINLSMGVPVAQLLSGYLHYVFLGLYLVVLILTALVDYTTLRRWGYSPLANPAWVLLSPLAYLIVRAIRVHKQARRGIAPLVFYIVSSVVVAVLLVVVAAIAVPAYLATNGGSEQSASQNAASFATGIANGLDKNGGNYTVTCTPFTQPTTTPVSVICDAIDSSGVDHKLVTELDPSATPGGSPTVRLISVNPAINN